MSKDAGLKPTCKEVHRLVSEGLDRDLSLIERTRMQMHLLICQACRNFEGQMAFIRKAMQRMDVPAGKARSDSSTSQTDDER